MRRELIWLAIAGKIPCMFQKMTGLYCPGCGGTRAVKALFSGQLLASFLYHPLILYCAVAAVIFMVSYAIYWKTKIPHFRLSLETGWIYGGLAILLINFVVKNYLLLVKNIDVLSMLPKV